MATSISEYVVQCIQKFQAASSECDKLNDAARQKFLDEFARFKIWAGNLGAHRRGRSSLDWRLRDASHLRELVINLLTDLKSSLHDTQSLLHNDLKTDQNEALIPEGSLGTDDIETNDDTEFLEIITDINDIIGCLLRLSVSIRNPAPHDHFMSSKFIDTSYFEEYDVEHVKAKFPHIELALAIRLGKAISQRRQYFKYRKAHHEKLNAGLDLDLGRSEAGAQSTIASSIPTALKDNENSHPAFSRLDEEEESNSGASQTSYATSGPESGRLKIPSLPKQASDGPFECPFCYMIISVSTTIQWKNHVIADLRPYTCVELDCLTPEQQYTRRRDWLEHLDQKHCRVFRCPYSCQEAEFDTRSQLERHLRSLHQQMSSQKDLSFMISLCERSMPWPEEAKCPLCQHTLYSKGEYARHVGRHQTELALFALPRNEDDEEDLLKVEDEVEDEDDTEGEDDVEDEYDNVKFVASGNVFFRAVEDARLAHEEARAKVEEENRKTSSKTPTRNSQNLTPSTIVIEPTEESQRFYNQNRREMDRQRLEPHIEDILPLEPKIASAIRGRRRGPIELETRTKTAFKRKFKLTCAFHRAKRVSCNCHDFSKLEEGYRKYCADEEQKARAASRGESVRPFGEGNKETYRTGDGVPSKDEVDALRRRFNFPSRN
ncbi:hypothetical protein F5B22DRAFT_494797 [Xylaria bambusicola]|uniref:uncharacterized protein n=1 Tax=Xylaria bambusicola TaxID=326684 RepID=UPI002008373A|nr:uncharacterized protein F5B22DRAFT_494797 [Xylaria bambusicola]KAI0505729.1 hypothetical protein F5B22DRAFT_494797 [Xylaria bambusicola]